jgi:hypothetical protein
MIASAEIPHRLSLLDDESDVVSGVKRRMERRGFELTVVEPTTASLEDTVREIKRVSDAALCDHDLRGGHQVEFSGADVVAALTGDGFPAVLYTGFLPKERYVIRRKMADIPAFLNREGGLRPEQLERALQLSVEEVTLGARRTRRKGRRTPVTITASRVTAGERLVSALVSGWSGPDPVEIPVDLLAPLWHEVAADAVGKTFMATVNIGEPDPDLLFFTDFESEPLVTESYEGIH